MSKTAQKTACDALVAMLKAAPALAGITVDDERKHVMPVQEQSHIYVFRGQAVPSRHIIGSIVWQLQIRIVCVARTVAGVSANDASDALALIVQKTIMADPSLGGTAIDIEVQGTDPNEEEADTALAAGQLFYSVRLQTPENQI